MPFALARSLTDVAWSLRKVVQDDLVAKLKAPTPYVVKSILVKRATKTDLVAEVYPNDESSSSMTPADVLAPHIHGGARHRKPSEARIGSWWVPGAAARLNRYGNIDRQELIEMLRAVQGQGAGPATNPGKKGTKGNSSRKFFRRGRVIYERKGRALKPVLILTHEPAYEIRLQWDKLARDHVIHNFPPAFEKRFVEAAMTAKKMK